VTCQLRFDVPLPKVFAEKKGHDEVQVLAQNLSSAESIAMAPAIRLVRLIQIAMLVGIGLCAVVGERLARTFIRPSADTLFHALSFISISVVGATMVLRRTLVVPSETALALRPDDSSAATRWKISHIFLYATCELVGLFGLVLRMAGFTLANVWGFYLGGFLLLLLYSPRAPRAQLPGPDCRSTRRPGRISPRQCQADRDGRGDFAIVKGVKP
jgi:hypothetical protein